MDVSPTPPVTLVIFGATGDLTRRLLVPAIVNLMRGGLVGDDLEILGIGIEPGGTEMLLQHLDSFLSGLGISQDGCWLRLRQRISYISGDFTKDEIYTEIGKHLSQAPSGNAAFYLAVPPRFFGEIVEKLAEHELSAESKARALRTRGTRRPSRPRP